MDPAVLELVRIVISKGGELGGRIAFAVAGQQVSFDEYLKAIADADD